MICHKFDLLQHGPRGLAVKTDEVFACFKQHDHVKVYDYSNDTPELKREVFFKNEDKSDMIIENPRGMDVDSDGNIYVADSNSHKLYKFGGDGILKQSVGGCGKGFTELHNPKGVVIADKHVFVCDLFNQRVQCFKCDDLDPVYSIYILKESNICPFHIACDTYTRLYITATNRIYICQLEGNIRNPSKAELKCSIIEYEEENETGSVVRRKFQRIGGIAVKAEGEQKVILVATEIFRP